MGGSVGPEVLVRRLAVPPTPLSHWPVVRTEYGTLRQPLVDPPDGPKLIVLTFPPGYRHRYADRGFEYHSCHEEIVLLEGHLEFGPWYSCRALAYLNHPPYWVHPADQRTAVGATMLVRIEGPVDFGFEPIPPDWDGVEYLSAAAPVRSRARGVSRVELDDLPWEPVTLPDGQPVGIEAKHLWDDPDDGWVTWLMRAPAGWHTRGGRIRSGGEELFLLEGDLTIEGVGELSGRSYYCDPDRIVTGKATRSGCLAIRWTRGGDYQLPPIRF